MKSTLNKMSDFIKKFWKKNKDGAKTFVLISILILLVLGPISIPKKTEAIWGVGDIVFDPSVAEILTTKLGVQKVATGILGTISSISEFVIGKATAALELKDYVLDGIAWFLINLILEGILRSTIDWVNSGFRGQPSFLSNPEAFFVDLADQAIGEFIYRDPDLNFLCSPYSAVIKLSLQLNRGYRRRAQCTLTRVIANFDSAFNNFIYGINNISGQYGGWGAWYALSSDNIYKQYSLAEAELSFRIANKFERQLKFLDWGRGFMSIPDCTLDGSSSVFGGDQIQGRDADETIPRPWSSCKTSTPGAVIQSQLTTALDIPVGRLTIADEINELIGALLRQLATSILSEGGSLFGLSKPSSGGPSYTDLLGQSQQGQFVAIRADTAQEVEAQIDLENRYITAKTTGLNRIGASESLLNQLISCSRIVLSSSTTTAQDKFTASTNIQQASSTLDRLDAVKAPTEADIDEANNNLLELESIRTNLDSFSADSLFDFSGELERFQRLLGRVHSPSEVVAAESSGSGNIGIDLEATDADTTARLNDCRLILSQSQTTFTPPIQ